MAPAIGEPSVKYHSLFIWTLTGRHESGSGTVVCGQFNWGGFLLKGNGGAQWYSQHGWQSCVERKGRRVLDCESDTTSRYESRP